MYLLMLTIPTIFFFFFFLKFYKMNYRHFLKHGVIRNECAQLYTFLAFWN